MADLDDRQARRLETMVDTYAAQRQSIGTALIRALLGLWGPFRYWYDNDMVDAYAARSAVLTDNAQADARRLARSYSQAMLRNVDSSITADRLPPMRDLYPRSGSTVVEVYRRPAEQYRYGRSQGLDTTAAYDLAAERIRQIGAMDITLADRDETANVYSASQKVTGRRRIIHPERSRTGVCGLCVVAADRLYYVDELMPVHEDCKCTEAPVTADFDPGLSLNRKDLEALYAAAGSTAGEDLKRLRITVNEHGELGPILRQSGQHFEDAAAVNKRSSRREYKAYKPMTPEQQRESWKAMIASSERSIDRLVVARDRGLTKVSIGDGLPEQRVKDFNVAIKYHEDLIRRYRRRLGR